MKYSCELTFLFLFFYFFKAKANSIISIILQRTLICIIILISNQSVYQISIKNTTLCLFLSISNSPTFTSTSIKLSLVNLMRKYLPAMKLLQPIFKLPNILKSVRNENAIAMEKSIFPLSNIFNSMIILLFDCFKTIVLSFELRGNILKLVIR